MWIFEDTDENNMKVFRNCLYGFHFDRYWGWSNFGFSVLLKHDRITYFFLNHLTGSLFTYKDLYIYKQNQSFGSSQDDKFY